MVAVGTEFILKIELIGFRCGIKKKKRAEANSKVNYWRNSVAITEMRKVTFYHEYAHLS